jgi:hypothetical protein
MRPRNGSERRADEARRTQPALPLRIGPQDVIDRELPLADAAEAHRLIEARDVFGQIVLRPWRRGQAGCALRLDSCRIQVLPSGSLKSANDW